MIGRNCLTVILTQIPLLLTIFCSYHDPAKGSTTMSMAYRMRRTLPEDRVAIIMPVDHGLIFNRLPGLESPSKLIAYWAQREVTGFMMSPGQVRQTAELFAEQPHLSRVLTIDTFYEYTDAEHGNHDLIATVEDAVRMAVDAVKMLMPWNTSNRERAALASRVGKIVSACERWEIPLILEPVLIGAPRTEEVIDEEQKVARIAYDLGAHILKIAFPGFERTQALVEELGLPVVIAGGPLSGDVDQTVDAVRQTIDAGARGVIVGRNIWQRKEAEAVETLTKIAKLSHGRSQRS
jgi:fructose-bisphosphate aldolase, class I